ncbi:MAG: riboflavin biosynthesis protein RibF [Lachnospiraceae bacterium]|nr:riboflavin biosynthesis protein RibF [Lachnospiraceae bacterium]
MRIISETTEFHIAERTVVAIGKFDGVHLGHQKLLNRMREWQRQGLTAVVFTFDRSPASIFAPGTQAGELTTCAEKRVLMEALGADILLEFPMTLQTAATPADDFVREVLVRQLNAAVIVAGEDLSFGHKGLGNRQLLEKMAKPFGYQVEIVDKLSATEILPGYDLNTAVSSTLVRELLEEGKMKEVSALCGRPYSVEEFVIHGKHLGGPVLHMPTINIDWPEGKLTPPYGVYYSQTLLGGKRYASITNVGCKPTVAKEQKVLAETYLYGFDGDAYGEKAEVIFYGYKRPEQKFENLDLLREHMRRDIEQGRAYWAANSQ